MILSLRPEDEGTFFCSAENPAGVAQANFSVRVLTQDGVKSSVVLRDSSNPIKDSISEAEYEDNMYKVSFSNVFFVLKFLCSGDKLLLDFWLINYSF